MRRLTKPGNKRPENLASRAGLKRVLSRGAGAGADRAPVSRLKKFLLTLKARRTTSKVVHADAPVRSRLARLTRPVAGKTSKKAAKASLAKRGTTKAPAKKAAKASLPKRGTTKTPAKGTKKS